ncbi:hypothetical protein KQI52_12165 [bacterium]|nr:hypothetical protein [bacterium]
MVRALSVLLALLLLLTPAASFANTHSFHIQIEDSVHLDVLLADTSQPGLEKTDSSDGTVTTILSHLQITDEHEFTLGYDAGMASDIGWPTWGWFLAGSLSMVPVTLVLSNPLAIILLGAPLSLTLLLTTLISTFVKDKPDPPERLWTETAGQGIDFQIGFAEGYGTRVKNQRILSTVAGIALSVGLMALVASQVEPNSDGQ